MSKRSLFTNVTALPTSVTRKAAVTMLHAHNEMIELNPLVIRHGPTKPLPNAPADERECAWYELTDKISYLPGGWADGEVTYKACFHDLPEGLQTHTYAPAGLEIMGKWLVGGNEPGEPREVIELGLNAPREGLYIREDVDMKCSIFLSNFVKRNIKRSHQVLVEAMVARTSLCPEESYFNLHRDSYSAVSQQSAQSSGTLCEDRPREFQRGDLRLQMSPKMQASPSLKPLATPSSYKLYVARGQGFHSDNPAAARSMLIDYTQVELPASEPVTATDRMARSADNINVFQQAELPAPGPTTEQPARFSRFGPPQEDIRQTNRVPDSVPEIPRLQLSPHATGDQTPAPYKPYEQTNYLHGELIPQALVPQRPRSVGSLPSRDLAGGWI